ncbi:hypothetical protein [Moumouvirus maliensis]|nr:hypothetical protein [Moumouvirus maliensis]
MSEREEILDFLFKNKSFIFGGYVYKYTIRGEETKDIDVAVPNYIFHKIFFELQNKYDCKLIRFHEKDGIKNVGMICHGQHFDLQDAKSVINLLANSNIELTRLVLVDRKKFAYLTNKGILNTTHSKIKQVKNNILQSKINNKNFKNDKHKIYFKDWEIC